MPYIGRTGDVTVVAKGKECDIEWKIDFVSLSNGDNVWYCSPNFSFECENWYLGIFPNGSKHNDTFGFIHLGVIREKVAGLPINLEFSLALRTVTGQKESEKKSIEVLDKHNHFYYTHRLISRSDLDKRQSEFLSSGFLTVVARIKIIQSTGNASDITLVECSYCKKTFNPQEISSHEKKCRIICPGCSDVILLENWNDHECQTSTAEGSNNASGPLKVHHHDKILKDLKQVLLKQEDCDVVLKVKGQEFCAHKLILAARSPVFASTFRNDMKEKETGIVDIEDCDPSIFPDFLCFLYSDDVNSLSEENVFGLFRVADKYDIPDLRKMCLKFMKENLSIATFCETITFALLQSEAELLNSVTDFFIKNTKKILVTVKWQSFVAENPTQSNELFIKFVDSIGHTNS